MSGVDHEVIIIGAGMSGLAAGIRLAQYDRRVCIVERHTVYGGLNSFYTRDGHRFDVGLHALTNYVEAGVRNAPLAKLLRQLRISRERLELCPQRYSMVCFPGCRLRFGNDVALLVSEVASAFPAEADRFVRFVEEVRAYDDLRYDVQPQSARRVLNARFGDRLLIEMLLCPLQFYGSAEPQDMDYTQFVTLFKSIFLEGLARPKGGVRRIIAELVKRYRSCGGRFRMGCGVRRLEHDGARVTGVVLDDGRTLTAEVVLSSAGRLETAALCGGPPPAPAEIGQLSFVESISVLDVTPAALGIDATIMFFNDAETFSYERPAEPIDPRSGVFCCPNNYADHQHLPEGLLRMTSLANHDRWVGLEPSAYAAVKERCYHQAADHAVRFIPEFRDHVVYRDIFTPRTIAHYTGHLSGAVYGAPRKVRDGRTELSNLFLCGTDQGFLGIIGAMLSGIGMANLHVLSR